MMTATVNIGRSDIACPRYTSRSRDGSHHEFNVTYVGGLLRVSHNAAGTCVGRCDWTFVLMLECCITSAVPDTNTKTSANVRTDGVAETSAVRAAITAPADVEATTPNPDDDGRPPTGLIVGIVVAVVVVIVVLVLSLATCGRQSSSLPRQTKSHVARQLYAPRPAPVDVVYTRLGATPLLNIRVPVRR